MKDSVYICYKTDTWHSYNSRDIIGICENFACAFNVILEQAKKEGYKISKNDSFNLNSYKQTQGYSGKGEFQIEEVKLNTLL